MAIRSKTQKELLDHYGFNKYKLTDRMRNCMHMPPEMLLGLEVYKMIHMSGKDFEFTLTDGQLALAKTNASNTYYHYDVIYQGCNPYSAKRAFELRLSFRKCRDDFGEYAYVLVQISKEGM